MAKDKEMVDDLDVKIITQLRKDGRMSFRKLGESIGVATGTVQARIKRMEDLGIINGYHVNVDFSKLGYTITAVIGAIGKYENIMRLEAKLAKKRNIIGIYAVTGEYDLLIAAKFREISELNDFIRENFTLEGIEKTVTFLVLQTVKEERGLFE